MGVGHGAHNREMLQGVPEPGRSRHIRQGGIAPFAGAIIQPERLAGNRIVISPALTEDRPLAAVSAIERKRLRRLRQAPLNQARGDLHPVGGFEGLGYR